MEEINQPELTKELTFELSAKETAEAVARNPKWFGRFLYFLAIDADKQDMKNFTEVTAATFDTLSPNYMRGYPETLIAHLKQLSKYDKDELIERGHEL